MHVQTWQCNVIKGCSRELPWCYQLAAPMVLIAGNGRQKYKLTVCPGASGGSGYKLLVHGESPNNHFRGEYV